MMRNAIAIVVIGLLSATAARGEEPSLKMYVAASTKEMVDAIAAKFTYGKPLAVEVSPGSSSMLAKQIAEGAPADLFLSADEANADYLQQKGMVARRQNLLGNSLVVVVPKDSEVAIRSLQDLAGDRVAEIALALDAVPAGKYAREALRGAGVWERIEPKVIGGEDVRATLAFVERGAAAGIVYRTDVRGDSKVRVALEIDPTLHGKIVYPLLLLKRDTTSAPAFQFYEYFFSDDAVAVIASFGFRRLP